jgi:hypothetical protein
VIKSALPSVTVADLPTKRRTVLDAKVEHLGNAGMKQLAQDLGLALEPIVRVAVHQNVGANHLDGDGLAESQLRAAKHDSHRALAEQRLDSIQPFEDPTYHRLGLRRAGKSGLLERLALRICWHVNLRYFTTGQCSTTPHQSAIGYHVGRCQED